MAIKSMLSKNVRWVVYKTCMYVLTRITKSEQRSFVTAKNTPLCAKDRENDFNFELYYFPGKLSGIDPEKVHRHWVLSIEMQKTFIFKQGQTVHGSVAIDSD